MTRTFAALPILLMLTFLISACASTPMPEKTYIPVPIPCEIEQVAKTELPTASPDANVAGKAAVAAARIELLKAENERLRAANNRPCPTEIEQ